MERSEKHDPLTLALLTPQEMADADRRTSAGGPPTVDLMDAAGRAVAEAVAARWPLQPVSILCGPGNNGGDGFAAGRLLAAAGWPVRIALLGRRERLSGDAARQAGLWRGAVEPFAASAIEDAGVVIDAVFGSGLSRPVEGPARRMIEALQTRAGDICAVDVPSGLDGATGQVRGAAAAADLTGTFFRKKPGHLLLPGRSLRGELVVADIGVPASVLQAVAPRTFENGPALWLDRFAWPQIDSHKYRRGEVLVLGGATTTGAARMTARAAMRAGAGLVTLAAPASAWAVYAGALEGAIVTAIGGVEDFEALLADVRRTAIAIGPGAGVDAPTRRAVLAALATKRAVVLDADALTTFATEPKALFAAVGGPCVLTPHEGEFARLFGAFDLQGDKLRRARDAAALCGAVVLLKGADTVIAAPDGRAIINANAPPQLATGGSGDVLTGFVAGLLAQGLDAFDAAAAAAWLHGEAGSAAGLGLVAGDLPEALPKVLQRLRGAGS